MPKSACLRNGALHCGQPSSVTQACSLFLRVIYISTVHLKASGGFAVKLKTGSVAEAVNATLLRGSGHVACAHTGWVSGKQMQANIHTVLQS